MSRLPEKIHPKIPHADPVIQEEDVKAVMEALRRKHLSQGEIVSKFERQFAEYMNTKFAVALNSATAALHACLAALGIKSGDEVITTPYSFAATANVIVMLGAKPVFVDILLDDLNINHQLIKNAITKRTKAILPVHYGGQCADMDEIMEISESKDIFVLEDAAEAHGAMYKKRKAGSLGHAGAFSFYPNKSMTTGEGGMLTIDNEELAEKVQILRNHGQDKRYHHVQIGWNYKMPDYVAALGIVQLSRLEEVIARKNAIATRYTEALNGVDGIYPPVVRPYNRHVFMLYALRMVNKKLRDNMRRRLENRGVETRVCFPSIHQQPIYQRLYGYKKGSFPMSELASATNLCLPISPFLDPDDQQLIIRTLREIADPR